MEEKDYTIEDLGYELFKLRGVCIFVLFFNLACYISIFLILYKQFG